MDASSELYPELPQEWDSNFFDQSYLDAFDMFELPDASSLLEDTHTPVNDLMAAEDIAFLDLGLHEVDTSNVSELQLASGFGTKDANQINLSSLCGSESPFESESSTSKVKSAERQASVGGRIRKLDDFLGVIEITRPQNPISTGRNNRGAYSLEKKQKVERVRKIGACVPCRLRKIACTDGRLCDGCRKSCGSITLANALCVRRKLLDVRSATDLWDRQRDLLWVKQEIPSFLPSPKRVVQLSFWDLCDTNIFLERSNNTWDGGHDGPYILPSLFEIDVKDFEPHPAKRNRHNLCVFEDYDSTVPAKDLYYAIPEESLPTLEGLEAWVLSLTRFKRRAIFGDSLQGSFMSLARRYYECERVLPLSDLMQKAVRLSCLHGLWCSALQEPRTSRQQQPIYASKAVHMQIAVILSEGIDALEHEILDQLQGVIFHTKGPGKENMLPIWTCLWSLILIYRRTVLNSEREGNGRLGLAQHMYETLISIYSGLFRPSSPLWLNFLKDEVFQLFGRDSKVTERLGTIKTELSYILNSGNKEDFDSVHDTLLWTLVLEHERKLGLKAHEKALSRPEDACAKIN